MSDKTSLLQEIAETLARGEIEKIRPMVLENEWAPMDTEIKDLETKLFDLDSCLVYLSRDKATVGGLADFIYDSVNKGGDEKINSIRREKLSFLAGKKSPFAEIALYRKPDAKLNAVLNLFKNGYKNSNGNTTQLIESSEGNAKDYTKFLVSVLNGRKQFITNKYIDLVEVILEASIMKQLDAIQSNDENKIKDSHEFDKAIRPLLYGLIQKRAFTSNVNDTENRISKNSSLLKLRDNLSNNLKNWINVDNSRAYNDSLINAYFHNLTLFSFLNDVTSDPSDWNTNIDSIVTLPKDGYELKSLASQSPKGYEKFKTKYEALRKANGWTESALTNPKQILTLLSGTTFALAQADDIANEDKDAVAIAAARAFAGMCNKVGEKLPADYMQTIKDQSNLYGISSDLAETENKKSKSVPKQTKQVKKSKTASQSENGLLKTICQLVMAENSLSQSNYTANELDLIKSYVRNSLNRGEKPKQRAITTLLNFVKEHDLDKTQIDTLETLIADRVNNNQSFTNRDLNKALKPKKEQRRKTPPQVATQEPTPVESVVENDDKSNETNETKEPLRDDTPDSPNALQNLCSLIDDIKQNKEALEKSINLYAGKNQESLRSYLNNKLKEQDPENQVISFKDIRETYNPMLRKKDYQDLEKLFNTRLQLQYDYAEIKANLSLTESTWKKLIDYISKNKDRSIEDMNNILGGQENS